LNGLSVAMRKKILKERGYTNLTPEPGPRKGFIILGAQKPKKDHSASDNDTKL